MNIIDNKFYLDKNTFVQLNNINFVYDDKHSKNIRIYKNRILYIMPEFKFDLESNKIDIIMHIRYTYCVNKNIILKLPFIKNNIAHNKIILLSCVKKAICLLYSALDMIVHNISNHVIKNTTIVYFSVFQKYANKENYILLDKIANVMRANINVVSDNSNFIVYDSIRTLKKYSYNDEVNKFSDNYAKQVINKYIREFKLK